MSNASTSGASSAVDDDVLVNDLAKHVQILTDRINDLEQEVVEKDQRIDELEAQQDQQSAIELRDAESPEDAEI